MQSFAVSWKGQRIQHRLNVIMPHQRGQTGLENPITRNCDRGQQHAPFKGCCALLIAHQATSRGSPAFHAARSAAKFSRRTLEFRIDPHGGSPRLPLAQRIKHSDISTQTREVASFLHAIDELPRRFAVRMTLAHTSAGQPAASAIPTPDAPVHRPAGRFGRRLRRGHIFSKIDINLYFSIA